MNSTGLTLVLTPPAGNCLSVLSPAGLEGLVGVGGICRPSSQDWVSAGAAALSGVLPRRLQPCPERRSCWCTSSAAV